MKDNVVKDTPLKKIMENWVKEPGYPVVSVTRLDKSNFNLKQNRFYLVQPINPDTTEWYIPIDYVTQNAINDKRKEWLIPENQLNITNATDSENSWILLNKDQTGAYYYSAQFLILNININRLNYRNTEIMYK